MKAFIIKLRDSIWRLSIANEYIECYESKHCRYRCHWRQYTFHWYSPELRILNICPENRFQFCRHSFESVRNIIFLSLTESLFALVLVAIGEEVSKNFSILWYFMSNLRLNHRLLHYSVLRSTLFGLLKSEITFIFTIILKLVMQD